MGIKELWSILTPFCERKPLFELQGKTVAVDLSCWICEAQNIAEYQIQPRMYLRNLYFRTCYLLLMDVIPVFVLEGKAPVLKYQTIADRNAVQFKGAKQKSDKIKTGKDRTRFHFVLKQCQEMLKYMGLVCVTGAGEAESMCAYLNADGLVAGCISQDSDCFAYGAQIVYRNFSISHQGSSAASGGAVDVYNIKKAEQSLCFGRNKIIALALLCGSDYNDGVHGVGKDSALKFMNKYTDFEILDRIRYWRKKKSLFSELEEKINNKNICSSCGHSGKIQSHTKNGCIDCKTNKGCDFSKYREERLEIKNELQIRNKALVDPEFPSEALIDEFLIQKDNVQELDLKWRQPNVINFVKFTNKFLGWEEIYAFEKFLPILTRWQLMNYKFVEDKFKRNSITNIKGIIHPKCIKKIRNPKGIPSYEIIWEDRQKCFDSLIPENQIDDFLENKNGDLDCLWSTIEPKYLVDEAYPGLVQDFFDKKKKPTKRKKPRKKAEKPVIIEPEQKDVAPTIESYFRKTKLLKKTAPKHELSFDLDCSKFGDEDDNFDVSLIVDRIVSKPPKLLERVGEFGYKCVFPEQRDTDANSESFCAIEEANSDLNKSSFFDANFQEVDLFEKTFCKEYLSNSSADDETINYDADEVDLEIEKEMTQKNESTNSLNDTFDFDNTYVPLYERIKKKNAT